MSVPTMTQTLAMLSGESFIPLYLLVEDEELIRQVALGTPYEQLMAYLNENF